MRKLLACLLSLCPAALAGPPPLARPAPILTESELQAAAAEVPVSKIDFRVPDDEAKASTSLAERFFNRPVERRYGGITSADWTRKWQLFADALVEKARRENLDSTSLDRCLRALNQGRNKQTMWAPPARVDIPEVGQSEEQIAAIEKEEEERYQRALKDRELHPEHWYNEHLAVVPVAAYLAQHRGGECWVVVCKWERKFGQEASELGHIMIWALDTKSAAVVAYVSCD